MKKILSMAVIVSLCISLVGCGNRSDSVKPETQESQSENARIGEEKEGTNHSEKSVSITLWTYPVGSWGNATTIANVISGFNRIYPNIGVVVKCLDYSEGDAKVEEAISNGTAPDVIFEGPERLVAGWGERGLMVDLSDLWSKSPADQIYDNVKSACQHKNGAYYEMPVCMTTHCMAINYEMFKAAGALQYIDQKNRTWSTDDFKKAVRALYNNGQKEVGILYCKDQGGDQGTRALITNLYGGTFTNLQHTGYTVNSKKNKKALEMLRELEGIRFDETAVGSDEILRFGKGDLAMAFCWNVSAEISQTIANSERDFDIFPMAFPTESGKPKLQGGIWGFGIFDNGDEAKIEAAKMFIEYMTSEDAAYTKAVLASTYWPVRDMKDDIYANDKLMSEYDIFRKYMGDYYQVTSGWTEARAAWWKMLQKIGAGEDIDSAVRAFDKKANAAAG